jgi:sugar phosphate isomerase/epimerase
MKSIEKGQNMPGQFKLGLNIDNIAMKPPLELAPGWDAAEIPITELALPYDPDEAWEKKLAEIKTWKQPPFTAASHWLKDECITGDHVTDFAELERQAEQTCRRLAQLSPGMVAGVWGNFFAVPQGFSRSTATDQALRYCEMVAKYADKYGVLIALEPTANPDTVFPAYTDGLEFVKKLDKPSIRVMADLNYFVKIDEPFQDVALAPELCLHVHIQGDTYQPNYGDHRDKILRIFRVLRDIGYQRTVSSAHPWISTQGTEFSYRAESAKTLKWLQDLRAQVYEE